MPEKLKQGTTSSRSGEYQGEMEVMSNKEFFLRGAAQGEGQTHGEKGNSIKHNGAICRI